MRRPARLGFRVSIMFRLGIMRNSLLKLGALAALTLFGTASCAWVNHGSPVPYSPFEIRIDSVDARGQLNVEEKAELFLLNKENELILVIPKEGFDRVYSFRHSEKSSGGPTIQNTIELRSNNPNVLLCHWTNPGENNEKLQCNTEITTNFPKIPIKGQNLWDLTKASGFLDQRAVETLLSFELDGKIGGQQFLVKGRMIFDSTDQRAFSAYDRVRSQNARNQVLIGVLLFASALILVAIMWLVFRLKRRKR